MSNLYCCVTSSVTNVYHLQKTLANVLVIHMDAGQVAYPYKVVHSKEANEEDHKAPKQKHEPAHT